MKIAPKWITSNSQPLGPTITEGDTISRAPQALSLGEEIVTRSDTVQVKLNMLASLVTEVSVEGAVLDDQRVTASGRNLTLNLIGLSLPEMITVTAIGPVPEITLLRGDLPAGLSVDQSTLVGTVGNLDQTEYRFTLRAKIAQEVRDRTFSLLAIPVDTPSEWVMSSMPAVTVDGDLGISYVDLGTLDRGQPYSRSLQAEDIDGQPAVAEILPHGLGAPIRTSLPLGLSLVGTTIRGTVDPNCPSGRYLFRLGFENQETNRIFCQFTVSNALSQSILRPTSLQWITPSGSLGEIPEGYPSDFSLEASLPQTVQYVLAPGSLPLPAGMTLSTTGQIRGLAPHVERDTLFRFRVRASGAGLYADRDFEFLIRNRYDSESVLDVRLKMPVTLATGMVNRCLEIIPADAVFRGGDPSFGLQRSPTIYVIKGLRPLDLSIALQGDGSAGAVTNDYHGPVRLSLGRHTSAVCRGPDSKVKYEVVYREILDPLANSGGFRFDTEQVVEDKVVWPQSPPDQIKYIFPRSLRNIRFDMIKDIGFATEQQSLRTLAGPNGIEGLPHWMQSRQIPSDPNSVLGYTPSLVICFVKGGRGKAVADLLNAADGLLPVGTEIAFQRYHLYEHAPTTETSFDDGGTTFDLSGFGRTTFDSDDTFSNNTQPIPNSG